jgi:aromatic ring-cleaving dioxygenase
MTGMPKLHGYHVHVYYDDASMPKAEKVRDALAANFDVEVGKVSGIVGPHLVPQFRAMFKPDAFQTIVPWLMFNHEGLDVLIHPLTDDEYDDHTINALWLGAPVPLKLEILPHGPYPAELLPKPAVESAA